MGKPARTSPKRGTPRPTRPDPFAIFPAAAKGDVVKVGACLRAGTAVDLRLPSKLTRENQTPRQTPLMVAAEKGHRPVVALLLKAGANPNAQDEYRHTALAKAVN